MIAWLKRIAARLECAFTGRHVKPRGGVVVGYRVDYWTCARCGAAIAVHRGPK